MAELLVDAGAFDESALMNAVMHQSSLSLKLAKLLVDAGAYDADDDALSMAASCQNPMTLELAELLMSVGYDPTMTDENGWDALAYLIDGSHPVDPQVTNLFLSAGCRMDLDGCRSISDERRLRFGQILKEHAEWKEKQDRMSAENSPADSPVDWRR